MGHSVAALSPRAAPSVLVETQQLSKRYGRVTSLRGCSLSVERGEVFGLLGPNGAGKTTLLRLLMGFLRPSGGAAAIDGYDCYRQSLEVRRRVSYLPGEVRLFRSWRARQVLAMLVGLRPGGNLPAALALAEHMGLDLARRVATMSTGMRQQLALALALSIDAPLVILDEPTSNLDPTRRADVLERVAQARRDGRTVLFSSHVLAEIEEVCDRVAILRAGELVHTQTMSELRSRHWIRGRVAGALPQVPPGLAAQVSMRASGRDQLDIFTSGELAPVLGWLAQLPLTEVRIEPVGLRAVYEQFHAAPPAGSTA